jgi:hypothetical protein
VHFWLAYRSLRRARAVARARARGVLNSAGDARTRARIGIDIGQQLDALEEELGDWPPGQRWVKELKDILNLESDRQDRLSQRAPR